MIVKGEIGNALTSVAKDHVVATTNDLYDEKLEMYQDEINANLGKGVAQEKTLVDGLNKLSKENEEIKSDVNDIKKELTSKTAKQQTLIYGLNQVNVKLDKIIEGGGGADVDPISSGFIYSLFDEIIP